MEKSKQRKQLPRHQNGFRIYTNEQLTDALNDIRRVMRIRTAAVTHCVPFSSTLFQVSGNACVKRMDPTPLMQGRQLPITKEELMDRVQRLVIKRKLKMLL